ncbi:bifunctional diguanylate cyclase/phosphodiesterase [Sedimenticola selenatireducens]|uniref:EAL domain-containing protein n=1 Tax=Sedimenticola selenatireducens TaxID=191960 RepID=A0A557S530_9GAMM|nr:bifunctional diguanylate cyclase/phosphodiesterase [Sedimenticola selenatireducens]TVO72447.1 EAL domain-containing protein [Sedimenticola selenatireducens]TVT64702.1 MAG: EAL domain-containing protein [Sedimenticola selenatireducens]
MVVKTSDSGLNLAPVILDQCSVGLFVLAQDGVIVHWNHWMSMATGVAAESAIGNMLENALPGLSDSGLISAVKAAAFTGEMTLLPNVTGIISDSESVVGASAPMVVIKPMPDRPRHVLVQVFDQLDFAQQNSTDHQYAKTHQEGDLQTRSILSSIADAVITTDLRGDINYMNVVAEKLTGWRLKEAMRLPLGQVFHVMGEDGLSLMEAIAECLRTGQLPKAQRLELVLTHRDGIGVAVEESVAPIRDEKQQVHGVVVVFRDVSQARRLAAQVSWQASHDTLTGLFNRGSFDSKLDELLQNAREFGAVHSMLYLDLDQFKIVNDTCGHVAGDELLRQIASKLSTHVRAGDTLARLGGDEFGVLLADCAESVAQRIANQMRQTIMDFRFGWEEKSFVIGVSIGVVTISAESESVERVLSAADTACYAAKDGGRNQVHLYQANAGEAAQRQGEMRWVSRIHSALEEDRFLLYAQAIVPVDRLSQESGHYEVLIRMLDESGDLVPPGAFIPAAERFGLMPRIDRWVVKQVFDLIKHDYEALVLGGYRFAINLSGGSVNDEDTLVYISQKMSEFRIPDGMISFEITETAAIANLSSATHFIRTLKKAGCRFSLDDFGSGLSSFAYLKNLPVDYLKIDGAFIRDLADDPIDLAMVQAINQIGQVMGLKTIAEFVESESVLKKLSEVGVDYAQGYGIARPEPLCDGRGKLLLGLLNAYGQPDAIQPDT